MKIINSVVGLFYFITKVKIFKPTKAYKYKRVAIIGAADSAFKKELGEYIDSFDIVIRINKALYTSNKEKEKFIGKKVDGWFHSFFENTETGGGGPLDSNLMDEKGVSYLINPLNYLDAYRRTFNYFRKYKSASKYVYHLPLNLTRERDRKFAGYKPTIGFTALDCALRSECKELFITGFTFWKTPYVQGYRDHVLDLEDNKKHFQKQGVHDADLEYSLFKDLLEKSKCRNIIIDDKLKAILESE